MSTKRKPLGKKEVLQSFDMSIFEIDKEKQMVNLTKMSKSLGKRLDVYLKADKTIELIEALDDLTPNGGSCIFTENGVGTWANRELTLDFSQWVSVKFKVFCLKHIDTLLQTGQTSLLMPQDMPSALRALANQYEENAKLESINENLNTALDSLADWSSIIKVAQLNGVSEKNFNWRILKNKTIELGYEVKRAVSPRYGYQNLYHINAFRSCYPQYNYSNFNQSSSNLPKRLRAN